MRVKARYRGEGNGRDGSPGDNGAQPAKAVGRYGWSDNRKISQWPIADASVDCSNGGGGAGGGGGKGREGGGRGGGGGGGGG
ncbi:hypothetical protein HZH66_012760 [Vespula vulgaris]|uniref:Uncharacterized protein n=1 Tax=Vespula vulgaris TaxID=7454 RepID=A0A834J8K9_VESVU|nr:hypothetical protein HZH66_012760 [Vespula vulgaris]